MTTLASIPVCEDQLDLLSLVADAQTPLGALHASDFRSACEAVADADGWVDPNLVSKHLHDTFGEVNPRWYSAQWAGACGKNGFMDTHREVLVPIHAARSKGNGNKSMPMRRLRATP